MYNKKIIIGNILKNFNSIIYADLIYAHELCKFGISPQVQITIRSPKVQRIPSEILLNCKNNYLAEFCFFLEQL